MTRKWLIILTMLAGLSTVCAAQSLAEAARKAREQKRESGTTATKVYTNESLGAGPRDAFTTGIPEAGAEAKAEGKDAKAKEGETAEDADQKAAEEKAKKEEELIRQVAEAKKEVEQLTRELDVYTREAKTNATVAYMDVGERVRNEQRYRENLQKSQNEVAAKTAALNAAKAKLDALREQARRANIAPGKIP